MGVLETLFGANGTGVLDAIIKGGAGGPVGPGSTLVDEIDKRRERAGFTPGFNPNAEEPFDIFKAAQQGNFGAGRTPTRKQVAAVNTAKDPSLANLLLSKLGGPGRKLMPVSNFLGEVGNALEGAARRGGLGSLAPNFQAGIQEADRADLNRRFIEAQIARMTAPQGQEGVVQSTVTLANGNIGVVNRFTGQVQDTGAKAAGKSQIIDMPGIGQVRHDPVAGTLTQVNPEEVIQTGTQGRSAAQSAGTKVGQAEGELAAQPIKNTIDAPEDIKTATIRIDQMNDNRAKIKTLKERVSLGTTGAIGAIGRNIPGTPAFDFAQLQKEVESFLSLDKIAEMKAQSETGATGLGAVNAKEFDALGTAIVNLNQSQSPASVKDALERVDAIFARITDTAQADIRKARQALGEDEPVDISSMTDEELRAIINGNN